MIRLPQRKMPCLFIFTFFLTFFLMINVNLGYDDNDDRTRVWSRVEENGINHKLYRFLAEQDITNCFEFREEPRLLRLRCLSEYNSYMFDVDVHVYRRNPKWENFNYTKFTQPYVAVYM